MKVLAREDNYVIKNDLAGKIIDFICNVGHTNGNTRNLELISICVTTGQIYPKNYGKISALKGRFIKEFDYNTFKNITRIASGTFCTVYRANSTDLGKHVALKGFYDNDDKKFVRELTNNIALNNHDNIIDVYGISIDPLTETYYMVLQYAKDGNLRTYLRNNFTILDWETKINMAKDLARGLQFIHQANIVHRDLNSRNVLVHEGRLLITVSVLYKSLDSDSYSIIGGMMAYTDPEYLKNQNTYKINKSSDIYSLGVLFWEISSGRPPFYNIDWFETMKKVSSGEREKPINGTPWSFVHIYSCAWNDNPIQRPTIENINNSLENIDVALCYNSLENIDVSLEFENIENSEEFERDSISLSSSDSTNSGIIEFENSEEFERDSISLSSSDSGIIDINNGHNQASSSTYVEKPEPMEDIPISSTLRSFANFGITDNYLYNPESSLTIVDHGEASTPHNEWFNDIIKNNGIIKYDYNVFKNPKYIGRGGFGIVDRATLIDEKMTKMEVALKSIFVLVHDIRLFVNELKQHSKVGSHENIIKFYGVSQKDLNSDEYILVLEYANGGTLRSHLKSNFKNLEWSDKLNLAQQIAKAIKHLHSRDILHRDLHSKNILIHNNIIKISDFGLAKLTSDSSISLLKTAGLIEYLDPMLLIKGDKFSRTKASDIYSFGMLLWELSSGEIPYKKQYSCQSKMIHILKGNRETPVVGTPRDYINIYQECWKQEPNQRPNIDKVMQVLDNIKLTIKQSTL
ncbi:hypothetical protein Glove_624g49 [Diversispora epigaea]|uniref:Protein kinase domain-containing protein n=1 Tax=Diversispora epigaea TaxID=1348612 RepID=A0A397G5T8_9GLOM|nr:hypothetical protein Glove_624g49 [Diversispora epigaea]